MNIGLWMSLVSARLDALKASRDEQGSVTLEQVVIAAGLLAAAVGLVAIIVAVVNSYSGKIH